jgi:phi LC3 family holin|nr:MAG TPA: holin [Caudoviricetes sp.]
MKINWTVRLKNKTFWLTAIPALLLLGSQILALFGVIWDYTPLAQQLSAITGTVFGLLALLGVVNDPTTTGVSDSSQALTYQKPKKNYVELTKK